MRGAALVASAGGVFAAGTAAAGPSASPSAIATLANLSVDFDRDGRPDVVFVGSDGRLVVKRGAGGEDALALPRVALDAASKVTMDLAPAAASDAQGKSASPAFLRVRVARSANQSDLFVLPLRLPLGLAFAGPVGPIGRDGEYSVDVTVASAPPYDLLRFQRAPGIERCDGESRLFVERYRDGSFRPAPELVLPGNRGSARTAATPTALAGVTGEPLGVYRFAAASAQGSANRADQLSPPRELEDGQRGTAWLLPSGGVGEWAVARAETPGSAVRALRVTPASPAAGSLPRQLTVLLGKAGEKGATESFAFDLPAGAQSPLWLVLPSKTPADCMAMVITAGPAKGAAAIAEVAVFADLDTDSDGLERLVKQVAGSDRLRAGGPLRMLQLLAQQPARQQALLAALRSGWKSAPPEGKRRLLEPSLATIAALTGAAVDSPLRTAAAELLEEALRSLPATDRPALFTAAQSLGPAGLARIERVGLDVSAPLDLRKDALLRLAAVKDPRSLGTLIAALKTADSALHKVLASAITAALRCKPTDDAGLTALRSELDQALGSRDPAARKDDVARFLGSLIDAAARAQSGCQDKTAARSLADRFAADYARVPGGASSEAFLLRYRLLEGVLTLKVATDAAVQLCEQVLASETEPVLRQLAVRAALLPGVKAGDFLARGLGDADTGVRLASLNLLAEQPELARDGKGLLPILDATIANDGWPMVRRAAIEVRSGLCAGGEASKSQEAASLRAALRDRDAQVQRAALSGIGRCLGENSVEAVAALARDVDAFPGSRGQACGLLSRYGFSSGDARRRDAAHGAVREVLLDLVGDPGADERHAAAVATCLRAIGDHGNASDLGPIMELVSSDLDSTIRRLSAESLAKVCERDTQGRARLAKSLTKLFRGISKRSAFEDRLRKAIDSAESACVPSASTVSNGPAGSNGSKATR